jgi:hypothetical protein
MLCCLLVGRKKKKEKKRETAGELFPQGQTHLAGCASWDFCGC